MGLVIHALKNIKQLEEGQEEMGYRAYVISKEWESRIKNLAYDKYYTGHEMDNEFEIAYPCSYHGIFRGHLLRIIGRADAVLADGKPDYVKLDAEGYAGMDFGLMINFADNDGMMDWEAAQELHGHFVKWFASAQQVLGDNEGLYYYEAWMHICAWAAQEGCIVYR